MTKDKQITLKIDAKSAVELLQVLDGSVAGYSVEYAPERIVRLRNLMDNLDKELEKILLK